MKQHSITIAISATVTPSRPSAGLSMMTLMTEAKSDAPRVAKKVVLFIFSIMAGFTLCVVERQFIRDVYRTGF
ncbi:hypothetical protein CE206_28815 (plasmid) [Achromobacter xylosoxidans]|nr:hypothetical protein CE206_28815 [Achromobacter xylosoxidans]